MSGKGEIGEKIAKEVIEDAPKAIAEGLETLMGRTAVETGQTAVGKALVGDAAEKSVADAAARRAGAETVPAAVKKPTIVLDDAAEVPAARVEVPNSQRAQEIGGDHGRFSAEPRRAANRPDGAPDAELPIVKAPTPPTLKPLGDYIDNSSLGKLNDAEQAYKDALKFATNESDVSAAALSYFRARQVAYHPDNIGRKLVDEGFAKDGVEFKKIMDEAHEAFTKLGNDKNDFAAKAVEDFRANNPAAAQTPQPAAAKALNAAERAELGGLRSRNTMVTAQANNYEAAIAKIRAGQLPDNYPALRAEAQQHLTDVSTGTDTYKSILDEIAVHRKAAEVDGIHPDIKAQREALADSLEKQLDQKAGAFEAVNDNLARLDGLNVAPTAPQPQTATAHAGAANPPNSLNSVTRGTGALKKLEFSRIGVEFNKIVTVRADVEIRHFTYLDANGNNVSDSFIVYNPNHSSSEYALDAVNAFRNSCRTADIRHLGGRDIISSGGKTSSPAGVSGEFRNTIDNFVLNHIQKQRDKALLAGDLSAAENASSVLEKYTESRKALTDSWQRDAFPKVFRESTIDNLDPSKSAIYESKKRGEYSGVISPATKFKQFKEWVDAKIDTASLDMQGSITEPNKVRITEPSSLGWKAVATVKSVMEPVWNVSTNLFVNLPYGLIKTAATSKSGWVKGGAGGIGLGLLAGGAALEERVDNIEAMKDGTVGRDSFSLWEAAKNMAPVQTDFPYIINPSLNLVGIVVNGCTVGADALDNGKQAIRENVPEILLPKSLKDAPQQEFAPTSERLTQQELLARMRSKSSGEKNDNTASQDGVSQAELLQRLREKKEQPNPSKDGEGRGR